MNSTIRSLGKIAMVVSTSVLLIAPGLASAQRPRLVITQMQFPENMSVIEQQLVSQIDFIQVFREAMLDSRTFSPLLRDDVSVQALLQEKTISDSPLAVDADSLMGLVTTDYFLEPVLRDFNIRTSYSRMELRDDLYERSDSVSIELSATIYNTQGEYQFEQRESFERSFPVVVADESARQTDALRNVTAIREGSSELVRGIVDGIVTRVNPLTILRVYEEYFLIDRGRNNGFNEGSRFMVFEPSETITHPVTGAAQVIPGRRIGEATVLQIYEDSAELRMSPSINSTINTGYTIRLIEE